MAIFDKHFTVEEARRELPEVRSAFARIHELLAQLEQTQMEQERIQKLIQSNGHGSAHPEHGEVIAEIQALVESIVARGIEIKDLQTGLIDFPHWRNDEEVFLCWRLGEEDIVYWHTLDAGFAGRQPLDEG